MISASRRLLFGTAGVPLSTPASSTLAAIDHVKKLGLDCLEVEFVKGTRMGNDTAREIGRKAESLGIRLSVHAPYYINLSSPEIGKRLASQERLIGSARLAHLLGAKSVVIHPGYYGQETPEKTADADAPQIRAPHPSFGQQELYAGADRRLGALKHIHVPPGQDNVPLAPAERKSLSGKSRSKPARTAQKPRPDQAGYEVHKAGAAEAARL